MEFRQFSLQFPPVFLHLLHGDIMLANLFLQIFVYILESFDLSSALLCQSVDLAFVRASVLNLGVVNRLYCFVQRFYFLLLLLLLGLIVLQLLA